jgi:hypothetical protein
MFNVAIDAFLGAKETPTPFMPDAINACLDVVVLRLC